MKDLAMRSFVIVALMAAAASVHAHHQPDEPKGLSAKEIEEYRAGAGMGYAKAAELNHFPGPMHVLELAGRLALTPEQRAETEKLMQAHKAEARAVGAKLVAAEHALEQLFRGGQVDRGALAQAVET